MPLSIYIHIYIYIYRVSTKMVQDFATMHSMYKVFIVCQQLLEHEKYIHHGVFFIAVGKTATWLKYPPISIEIDLDMRKLSPIF